MIKTFLKKESNGYFTVTEIDETTGSFTKRCINDGSKNINIDYPFECWQENVVGMGYGSAVDCITQLKRRGILGEEVRRDLQRANEIGALARLAWYRNTSGLNYEDIPERLQKYFGLSLEYANKIVDYSVLYNIERHIIRAYNNNNKLIYETAINGNPAEIEKNYIGFKSQGEEITKIEFVA